jgi:hypothetical protein
MDEEKQELIATLEEDLRITPPGFIADMLQRALAVAKGKNPPPYDAGKEYEDERKADVRNI